MNSPPPKAPLPVEGGQAAKARNLRPFPETPTGGAPAARVPRSIVWGLSLTASSPEALSAARA